MIRPATPDDKSALLALAEATGLFESDQLEELDQMLCDYFTADSFRADRDRDYLQDGKADRFWIADDEQGLVGVAYCEMERMTDRTWNLQLIAIHPDCQGQGRGTKLLRYVEQTLAEWGGRVLLVETSGTPDFERTRAFYCKSGYDEEARIRDFYTEGADKIVYRKVLLAPSSEG